MWNRSCPENPITHRDDRSQDINQCYDIRRSNSQDRGSMVPSQPYFIPGYTGWTPGSGPKRQFIVGDSYGSFTHNLLHDHRVAGSRLNPLNGNMRLVNYFKSPTRHLPKVENPHGPIDPFFIPGYTGYIPGSSIKRCDAVGETYSRMSHIRIAKHPVAGNRLRSMYKEPPENIADREEVKFYCNKHELIANDLKRRYGMVPGYTGHMPRALFRHGKTATKIGNHSIAEFEQIMERKNKIP